MKLCQRWFAIDVQLAVKVFTKRNARGVCFIVNDFNFKSKIDKNSGNKIPDQIIGRRQQ